MIHQVIHRTGQRAAYTPVGHGQVPTVQATHGRSAEQGASQGKRGGGWSCPEGLTDVHPQISAVVLPAELYLRRRFPLLLSHNMKYAGPLGLCPETTY